MAANKKVAELAKFFSRLTKTQLNRLKVYAKSGHPWGRADGDWTSDEEGGRVESKDGGFG